MPEFVYTARDRQGLVQTGRLEAVDRDEVVALLQNRGLVVTSVMLRSARQAQASARRRPRRLHGRVTTDDQVVFCQQLATLIGAAIPLLKSLEVLEAQVESRALLQTIEQMRRDIEGGSTFRDAVAKHPRIFTRFWVHLIETGEASGHLAQSLQQLSRYLESAREIQQKAMTALLYPTILIAAAVAALAFFMLKIVPAFTGVFATMKIELPLLTQLVIAASEFTRRYILALVVGAVAAVYAIVRFVRTEQGRWLVDHLALKLPVFGGFIMHLQLAQFARGLSTLLDSGVPIIFSLEVMEHSASNKPYGRAIGQIKEGVRGGKLLADEMSGTGLFPPMMVQMIQVGEEIGELGMMLDRVAKYYEERVATFIARMTVLFEPIAIAVMAVIIGTIVIAIFLPIFSMAGGGTLGAS